MSSISDINKLGLIIGPEGDFAPEETKTAFNHGAKILSFGPYTYRSELAATIGITLIMRAWGELG